jgi:cellulose synthase operon protein C
MPKPQPIARVFVVAAMAVLAGCAGESPQQLVAKGKAELSSNNAAAAVVRFKAALQQDSASVPTRVLLGRALLQAGDAGGAALELTKALEQGAAAEEALPPLATAMLLSGQVRRLTEAHGNAVLKDPAAQAELQTQLAAAWALVGNNKRADQAIAAAAAAEPDSLLVEIQRARLLMSRREMNEAAAVLDKILQRDPRSADAWFLRGEALSLRPDARADAEAALRKAIELQPALVSAHASLAVLKIRMGDVAAARQQIETLRGVAPKASELLFLDAQMAWHDKDYRKAREAVQQLLKITPDNTNLLQLAAAVEWSGGSLVIAERYLNQALKVDPTLDGARINLGHIYNKIGQPARALQVLQPLLASEAAGASALGAAGAAALMAGDPAAAEAYYARAAVARPEDFRTRTALAMSRLARGNEGPAFSELELLASQSKDDYADAALVSERLKRSQLDDALKAVDKMLAKQPDSAQAHELRGRVLVAKRDLAAARQAFEKALSLEPRMLLAMVNLADLDLRESKPEAARKRIEDYLKVEPTHAAAVAGLANLRLRAGTPVDEVVGSLRDAIRADSGEVAPRLRLVDILLNQRQVKAALVAAQERLSPTTSRCWTRWAARCWPTAIRSRRCRPSSASRPSTPRWRWHTCAWPMRMRCRATPAHGSPACGGRSRSIPGWGLPALRWSSCWWRANAPKRRCKSPKTCKTAIRSRPRATFSRAVSTASCATTTLRLLLTSLACRRPRTRLICRSTCWWP